MSLLKALLSTKTLDAVATTSNIGKASTNGRKRGAVLEEWLLRKFPKLYKTSNINDCESTINQGNDIENQPLDLVKRSELDTTTKSEISIVCNNGIQDRVIKSCLDNDLQVEADAPINLSLSKKQEPVCKQCGGNLKSCRRRRRGNGSVPLFATKRQFAKQSTTPRLTKHNDAAYYPNIQCLLCREWVCSRNRYMHVESHLQYRPYKCSFCGYDNRKEIFIVLHIKKVHGGRAEVIRDINTELEHKAWNIAERCVEHTRDVLQRAHLEAIQDFKPSTSTGPDNCVEVEPKFKCSAQCRPTMCNVEGAEKSLVIENLPKTGTNYDLNEVSNGEVQYQTASRCFPDHFSNQPSSHISRQSVISRPTSLDTKAEIDWRTQYNISSLPETIHSVVLPVTPLSSTSKPPISPTSELPLSRKATSNFTTCTLAPSRSIVSLLPRSPILHSKKTHFMDPNPFTFNTSKAYSECKPSAFRTREYKLSECITLTNLLTAAPKSGPPQARVQPIIHPQISRKICSFCQELFEGDYLVLYRHVKQHLSILPYECSVCKRTDVDRKIIQEHISRDHDMKATLIDRMTESVSRQCCALFTACFPDVPLQQLLHDSVQIELVK